MEHLKRVNGVDLWTDDVGNPTDPAILLIHGRASTAAIWTVDFCAELAAAGFHVLRYDQRDCGRSTYVDFDEDPYTMGGLADDAAALLTEFGHDSAHVVGVSMGGIVAQELAIRHRRAVASLVLVCSTASTIDAATGAWTGGLPDIDPAVAAELAQLADGVTPDGRTAVHLRLARLLAGRGAVIDEAAVVRAAEAERDHELRPANASNRNRALALSADRTEGLRILDVPTLIVHGADDPIFGREHGTALARAIPGSTLRMIEGMGHELRPDLARAIIDHARAIDEPPGDRAGSAPPEPSPSDSSRSDSSP